MRLRLQEDRARALKGLIRPGVGLEGPGGLRRATVGAWGLVALPLDPLDPLELLQVTLSHLKMTSALIEND